MGAVIALRLGLVRPLRQMRRRMGAAMGQSEVDDARHDLGPEARAVEHAIMADLRLDVMDTHLLGDVDAQILGGFGLADAGNVVILALDGQKRDALDRAKVDPIALEHHLALRQRVLDEDLFDRLKIELGRHVHDGVVFVIEGAVLLGGIAVIVDEMPEEVLVGDHVPVEIHRHEARQLQEARIDLAGETRLGERHGHDDIVAEPLDALHLSETVHGGRMDASVDRSAHQRHRRGCRVVAGLFHRRDRHQHRDGGLTDRQNMGVGAELAQKIDDILGVVVEVELALGDRHHAGIGPVGDINVGIGKQRLDRAAQKRRIMAGKRRDDQEAGIGLMLFGQLTVEVKKPAERLLDDNALLDVDWLVIDDRLGQPEVRLGIDSRRTLEQLGARRDRATDRGPRKRIQRVLIEQARRVCSCPHRAQSRMVPFVEVIQHRPLSASSQARFTTKCCVAQIQ